MRSRLSPESDHLLVGEVASGEEALAVVRALEPAAIVIDVEMPALDDLVTMAAVWTAAPNNPVMTLSLRDDVPKREKPWRPVRRR